MVSLANWAGHIKAGSTVDEMIHAVDMYPTLAEFNAMRKRLHMPPALPNEGFELNEEQ